MEIRCYIIILWKNNAPVNAKYKSERLIYPSICAFRLDFGKPTKPNLGLHSSNMCFLTHNLCPGITGKEDVQSIGTTI